MEKRQVRTRFAPSPTGYMHVGNLRTALYAYLVAKKAGGAFILRIEDTDRERLVEGAVDIIYNTLREAGLLWDEGPDVGGDYGPYIQSERMKSGIYLKYAKELIDKGAAYYCFCDKDDQENQETVGDGVVINRYDGRCSRLSPEEVQAHLDAGDPYVIRQKMPREGSTTFHDEIYGDITVENSELEDQILIKRDGMPTYNFANVIDDYTMGITHVIRGNEYLSSTPKYNLLYEALGWEIPKYIHCAPVMKDEKHKLSKRNGDASYQDLVAKGYLTPAILNYIALLGWAPKGEQEIFTLPELVEEFGLDGISKSGAIFDPAKLRYINGEYIRRMTPEEFYEAALPWIRKAVTKDLDTRAIAALLQKRCEVLEDIPGQVDFLQELPEYGEELHFNKKMKTSPDTARELLPKILEMLEAQEDYSNDALYEALSQLSARLGVKNGQVLWPLRVAVSGKAVTPGGATEICAILGKEETLRRIRRGLELLGA